MEQRPTTATDSRLDPPAQDVDAAGVDRAQIRAMLRLSPEERLRRVEEFVASVAEIRELNALRPVR